MKHTILLLLTALCSLWANAQLKADFTIDNSSGCSPLTVSFTNKTTGASASVKYHWSMGNGNTADATNVQAVYTEAKTYTITLTATDGGQTSTKSQTITVYKNPVVDFTADPVKACAPADITFTSKSTAGDGTITNYFWDYGDGSVEQGADLQKAVHRFTFAQKPPVKLTVTNSHGCYATAEKSGLVTIIQGLRIAFTANKTELCALPETVGFRNTTTGPGDLSYHWSFGDGQTATEKEPGNIVYDKKGSYAVKLVVTSTEGCTDSLVKTDYINAANFDSKFSLPPSLCTEKPLLFENKSTPTPTQSLWKFSDDNSSLAGTNMSHTFQRSGNFEVQLINTFGTCKDTATESVSISVAPRLPGFVTDKNGSCKAPLTVAFEDTSTNALRWHWNFGTGNAADTANTQKASFTFTRFGNYTVTLTVTNASGCQSSVTKNINVNRPDVRIGYTSSSSPFGLNGCPGMEVKFSTTTDSEISEYRWDFGDGSTSADAAPKHRFNDVGSFTVKLFYKTEGGCEDSVIARSYVTTYQKPKAEFESLSGLTICGSTPVRFHDLTDTATRWYWNFGDGGTSTEQNPTHSYSAEGEFTVTLVATNQYCSDTALKPQFIKLVPPFPEISGVSKNCNDRGAVTFRQSTQGATKWEWDFGDGSTSEIYNTNKEVVTHTYTRSGVYKVFLYASNSTCTTYDTVYVSVMLKQKPVLTVDKDVLCGSDTVTFKVTGLDTIHYYYEPNKQYYTYPYSGRFINGSNTVHAYTNSWYPPEYAQWLTTFKPGTESYRIITYDGYNGCYDTSNAVTLKVSGPVAAFKASQTVYCAGTDVTFTDQSKGTGDAAIKQWIWNFYDNRIDTLTTGGTVKHHYTTPGNYYPKLKVVDENGCFAETPSFGTSVAIYGPVADFYTNDTLVQPNTPVQFYNTTNNWPNYPVTYTWDFGDGSAKSSATSPAHTYTKSGTYTVTLIAKSSYGCADTLVRTAYVSVKTVRAVFETTASYVNNNSCPPLLAIFKSTSINADSLFWDFGDNSFADNTPTPSHTYYQPGVYKVKLYAFGLDAVDSTEQEVMVNGPYGTITPDMLTGCSPTEITLTAVAKNAVNFTWDFNDGYVAQGTDTAAAHVYTKEGIYMPKVILKDAMGCTSTFLLEDSIIIDKLSLNLKASQQLVCDSATVTFTATGTNFGRDSLKAPLQYKWEIGDEQAVTTQSPLFAHHFNKQGEFPVRLTVSSAYGCTQILTDTISVAPKPKVKIEMAEASCIDQSLQIRDGGAHLNGETWRWQFGDGRSSTKEDPDSIVYSKAGTYQLALFKSSTNGCADTAYHTLIVDQLSATATFSSKLLCDSGTVQLRPVVSSYALDSLGVALNYRWQFGAANSTDFLFTENASVVYNKPSKNRVALTVTSPYGCSAAFEDSVTVLKTPRASILSDDAVCAGTPITFRGKASEEDALQWQWDLGGVRSEEQLPPAQTYNTAGTYNIQLIVFNNPACKDTAIKPLAVNPLPQVALSPNDTTICRGASITLAADDGVQYTWTVGGAILPEKTASIVQTPLLDQDYKVSVINQFGCKAEDSVSITVSQPFTINAQTDKDIICATHTAQLTASGAVRYKWAPTELSDPDIANPIAQPSTTTTYTVVGYGADHCFTDTATVRIEVVPLPTVQASNDTTVLWHTTVPLLAQTSNDVTNVLWAPAAYLSCVNCKTPVSTPLQPMEYTVTVQNSFGCKATDTVRIALQCEKSTIHVPNAFTPNGDGNNDVFYVLGGGASINYIRIFNRWGELVFERTKVALSDRSSGWDGTANGLPLPSETYVYLIEATCEGGQKYQLKGTVTLIR